VGARVARPLSCCVAARVGDRDGEQNLDLWVAELEVGWDDASRRNARRYGVGGERTAPV